MSTHHRLRTKMTKQDTQPDAKPTKASQNKGAASQSIVKAAKVLSNSRKKPGKRNDTPHVKLLQKVPSPPALKRQPSERSLSAPPPSQKLSESSSSSAPSSPERFKDVDSPEQSPLSGSKRKLGPDSECATKAKRPRDPKTLLMHLECIARLTAFVTDEIKEIA